jgi:hypothetical protein
VSRIGVAAAVLVVLASAAAYRIVGGGRLVLVNQLAEPIMVANNGAEELVEPGQVARVWRSGAEGVRWRLVRPGSESGPGWGMELSGVILRGEGPARREIRARAGEDAFFAPLITNATDQDLTVTVNAGLQGSEVCCTVPAGATRAHIGYYPLFQNSTVRVEDPRGRWAMFTDLGTQVDANSGTVGLRFEGRDLRR